MQWALGSSKTKKAHKAAEDSSASGPDSPKRISLARPEQLNAEAPATLHKDAHEEGGLACTNDELLRVQQKAINKWIKGMGQKLLQGNLNLINTPFPVDIFEPRSYLEKLADVWVYPRYLRQAAAATDALERMKFVITWFIAGLHHSFEKWRKPFNPILGETWQATLSDGSAIFMEQTSHHPPVSAFHIEGPGGCYRFVGLSEPTVSLLLMQGGFKTVAKGSRSVQFPDGTHIDISYPAYAMKGIANSTLSSFGGFAKGRPRGTVEGTAVFSDAKHSLRAVVRFGADKQASGVNKHILRRSDAVHGEIYDMGDLTEALSKLGVSAPERESLETDVAGGHNSARDDDFESASETDWDMRDEGPSGADAAGTRDFIGPHGDPHSLPSPSGMPQLTLKKDKDKDKEASVLGKFFWYNSSSQTASPKLEEQQPLGKVVSTFQGSWLSHMDFDGVRLWAWEHERPDAWRPVPNPLPSDCQFREDLVMLARGADLKVAQAAKEKLEQLQRHDKKLRSGA